MEHTADGQASRKAQVNSSPGHGFEAVVPNPKLRLLDPVREILRLRSSMAVA